jgi:hypothetical protein
MTRSEHVAWCKERALKYLEVGDVTNAWASMASDLQGHSETKSHPALQIGTMMVFGGKLKSVEEMRKFIEGFN